MEAKAQHYGASAANRRETPSLIAPRGQCARYEYYPARSRSVRDVAAQQIDAQNTVENREGTGRCALAWSQTCSHAQNVRAIHSSGSAEGLDQLPPFWPLVCHHPNVVMAVGRCRTGRHRHSVDSGKAHGMERAFQACGAAFTSSCALSLDELLSRARTGGVFCRCSWTHRARRVRGRAVDGRRDDAEVGREPSGEGKANQKVTELKLKRHN